MGLRLFRGCWVVMGIWNIVRVNGCNSVTCYSAYTLCTLFCLFTHSHTKQMDPHTYTLLHTLTHIQIHILAPTHMDSCSNARHAALINTYPHIWNNILTYTHTPTHAHTPTFTHLHIRIHTHTHSHTQMEPHTNARRGPFQAHRHRGVFESLRLGKEERV